MNFGECDISTLLGFPSLNPADKVLLSKAVKEKAVGYMIDRDIPLLLNSKDYKRFIDETKGTKSVESISSILSALLPGFKTVLVLRTNDLKKLIVEKHLGIVARNAKVDPARLSQLYASVQNEDWEVAEQILGRFNIHGSFENLLHFINSTDFTKQTEPYDDEFDECEESDFDELMLFEDVDILPCQEPAKKSESPDTAGQDSKEPLPAGGERILPAWQTIPKDNETRKKHLPPFDVSAANQTSARMLDISVPIAIKQALDFIAGYQAYLNAPAFSCFVDAAARSYVPRVAALLSDAFHCAEIWEPAAPARPKSEKGYKLLSAEAFQFLSGKYPARYDFYTNLKRDLDRGTTICVEKTDFIAMLTVSDFDALLYFLRQNKNFSYIFFGDFEDVSGDSASRLSAIRNALNVKDFSINIKVDEIDILSASLSAAGFSVGKSTRLEQSWSRYRVQNAAESIDDAFESYISKTVFHHLSTIGRSRTLSDKSISWVSTEWGNNTVKEEQNALAMLDKLTGLHRVKDDFKRLITHAAMSKKKADAGLPAENFNLNFLFLGNPGTGKTTVAYILAKALKECGLLKSGHLITASRATLIGRYTGETAQLVRDVVLSSLDGILFIDEAYSLYAADSSGDNYGIEALNVLTYYLTLYKNRISLILAGYTDQMEHMLTSVNPGLRDRFPFKIFFENYTAEELMSILYGKLSASGLLLEAGGEKLIEQLLRDLWQNKDKDKQFANGRLVENIVHFLVASQEQRLAEKNAGGKTLGKAELALITLDDCRTLFANESLMKPLSAKKEITLGFGLPEDETTHQDFEVETCHQ